LLSSDNNYTICLSGNIFVHLVPKVVNIYEFTPIFIILISL